MRSDRDKRSDTEREIDDFLAQFDTPVDEIEPDVNSYLGEKTLMMDKDDFLDKFDVLGNKPESHEAADNYKPVYVEKPFTAHVQEAKPAMQVSVPEKEAEYVAPVAKPEPEYVAPVPEPEPEYVAPAPETVQVVKEEVPDSNEPDLSEYLSETATTHNDIHNDVDNDAEHHVGHRAALVAEAHHIKEEIKNIDKQDLKQKLFYVDGKLSVKKIILDCIGLGVALGLCLMVYFSISILLQPPFDFRDVYSYVDQSSIIYDDQGKQVDQVYYTQNRKITKYEEMPENLVNAFVALEDKTFWKHHGFNWIRMGGAVVSSITGGGSISGTSTITQQLARNVYLSDIKSVRSIKRKVIEMYYASRLEACMDKKEIVEAYLNTIYLGYGCYGVDAAAKAYFSKDVKDLTLVECASLAALPQAPDTYALVQCVDATTVNEGDTNIIMREPDTYIANDTAKFRRDIALDFMKEQGYITDAEYREAYNKDLIDFVKPTIKDGNGSNSYFHEYLVDTVISDLMDKYKMTEEDAERMIYTKGLKIYSTMDSKAQKTIVKEFSNPANYPGLRSRTDGDGNIISDDGVLLLYKYSNFFDDNKNFKFKKNEVKVNADGSITIMAGHRLNIYTTEYGGVTDYSLEFKQTYTTENGVLYAIPGGYINVPVDYKSLDDDGNLVISANYFTDYPDAFKVKGSSVTITQNAYSLPQKTIQPQSAMVIVGVGTGEIKAMVGGRSTRGERLLNRATNARQPGSSIKPLAVYGAALQKSFELAKSGKKWEYTDYKVDKQGIKGYGDYITTHSSVADERCTVNGETWPLNSNNRFTGKNTFMTAIQQSINTCAFKIQMQVGAEYSAQMLEKFGLTTVETDASQQVNDLNPAALALGGMTNGVKPLEMALAYSAFPAGGVVNTPICYTKVVDRDGKEILVSKSEQKSVLDEGVAWIMTHVLQTVVTKGIAGPAAVNNVQSGGKTGTTHSQCDIWFDGFTPTYAASLWIGTDNNIPLTTMSGPAAALWGKIMRQLPAACTGTYKPMPANVVSKEGCYFTKGTEDGLSSYNGKEEKLMEEEAKKRAYEEWLAEREAHGTWIVDCEAYDETIYYDEEGHWDEDTTPPTWVVDVPAHEEVIHHEEEGHWKYEPGWGDDDFHWDGTIPDDIREKYENM